MQGYRHSQEYVFDELQRLDVLLHAQIARQRREPAYAEVDPFRGTFIATEEIDLLIGATPQAAKPDATEEKTARHQMLATIEQLEQQIARKTVATLEGGMEPALLHLTRLFQLAPFDVDVLLMCAAPELDLKYEKLYAYLQNDVMRKRPSVALILQLLCHSREEEMQARTRLLPEAPLLRHQFLTWARDVSYEPGSSLARSLAMDERVLYFLLDIETMDTHIAPFTRRVVPRVSPRALSLPADLCERLIRFFQAQVSAMDHHEQHAAQVILLYGPPGVGKKFTAEALCQSVGLHLLIADVPQMLALGLTEPSCVSRLWREARLRGAVVYLDHAEVLWVENERTAPVRRALFHALEMFPGVVFMGSEQPWQAASCLQISTIANVELPMPDYARRRQLWQTLLTQGGYGVSAEVSLDDVANTFGFTAGQICHAIARAQQLAMLRDPKAPAISMDDLYQSCRAQPRVQLTALARKITPLYTWEDIVLPRDRLQHLREICAHAKYRQRVFSAWGFDGKMSLGKGLSMLFVGPSGTGKTMAADIIAGELRLDLYKIDLSCVVSKYIGETEKNLNTIFAAAEYSNSILFFDEADAIFGKRSEVKDAHDRYANIEINYLLQKMEEYEGITILASNFHKNLDDAFARRLRFVVAFPFPEEADRARLWQRMFPSEAPLGDDIDVDFLARKLKLTGGHIRNIALNAAFLAAANGGVIGMEQIIRATKREFQKMGRLCVKTDFEQYFNWVGDER